MLASLFDRTFRVERLADVEGTEKRTYQTHISALEFHVQPMDPAITGDAPHSFGKDRLGFCPAADVKEGDRLVETIQEPATATAVLTIAGSVNEGEIVEITKPDAEEAIQFVFSATGNGNVGIPNEESTALEGAQALANAITAHSDLEGWGADVSENEDGDPTVTLTYPEEGAAGNATQVASSMADGSWDAATMTGGADLAEDTYRVAGVEALSFKGESHMEVLLRRFDS